MKTKVGYCSECGKYTEHRVIQCEDNAFYRTFETVFTLGLALALEHNYKCKCLECGKINTLSF
jgi:hypothetical protein